MKVIAISQQRSRGGCPKSAGGEAIIESFVCVCMMVPVISCNDLLKWARWQNRAGVLCQKSRGDLFYRLMLGVFWRTKKNKQNPLTLTVPPLISINDINFLLYLLKVTHHLPVEFSIHLSCHIALKKSPNPSLSHRRRRRHRHQILSSRLGSLTVVVSQFFPRCRKGPFAAATVAFPTTASRLKPTCKSTIRRRRRHHHQSSSRPFLWSCSWSVVIYVLVSNE